MSGDDFTGRVCFVTGAGCGIGREIAQRFAQAGASVAALDRDAAAVRDVVAAIERAGGRAVAIDLDLRDLDAIPAAFDRAEATLGPIDALVNNAAIVVDRPFLETSREALRDVLAVNLEAAFVCAQRAARSMIGRGGRIVNLASHSALRGSTNRAAYAASKGGLVALTRVMAVELAPHRIAVNAIAPGPIESDLTNAHSAARRAAWERAVPLHRYGSAAEVAAAVLFLASDAASYITGQTLAVDGGFTEAGLVLRQP